MTELYDRPLAELAAALGTGAVSAEAVAEEAILRHERYGEALHAYKLWDAERFRAQARAADAALAARHAPGPVHGIPVSVKDLYGLDGTPTFAGTPRRLPSEWECDGPVVAALRCDGAVFSGKTHTVEFAFGGLGTNPHWGTPRNPWDAKDHRVPGGSSSGAGVSVIEGSAIFALGSDTAGSVRIPATLAGIVGLKVGIGRWSADRIVPLASSLDTPGVLARTVADAAHAFAVIDPAWAGPEALLERIDGFDLAGFSLGISNDYTWQDASPGVVEAVESALRELADKGVRLAPMDLPEAKASYDMHFVGGLVAPECAAFLHDELPAWIDLLDPIIAVRIKGIEGLSAIEMISRQRRAQGLAATARERLAAVGALAMPTAVVSPPKLEEVADTDDYLRLNRQMPRNTVPVNMLGLIAITLPVGLDAAGLPVGLQLVMGHGEEERLLALALAVERALGTGRDRLGVAPLVGG